MGVLDWIVLTGICLISAALGVFFVNRSARPQNGPAPSSGTTHVSVALENAPIAIWAQDRNGQERWENTAYSALKDLHKSERTVKDGPAFTIPESDTDKCQSLRAALFSEESGQPEWYDVTWTRELDVTYCYAQNVTALVNVEESKKDFFQTMAGTFAQLSTGLAIFDQDLRLYLFNPALVDLCGVPFSFLSAKPTLATFFDRLRDSQSMPEPKDYASWRQDMATLARAAAEGRYQETWTLPSGSVYQVTGRPHPGGAIAFLFEDISAEVGLARQFRTELDLMQSVLDTLPEPICVLSSLGKVMFVNTAYRSFWNVPPDHVLRGLSLEEIWCNWADPDVPLPRTLGSGFAKTRLQSETGNHCSAQVLGGGGILISFGKDTVPAALKLSEPV